MPRDPRAYLWDVREAALSILSFVDGLDVEAYGATPLVHSAVERKFEIMGEALSQLAKIDPALAMRVPHLPQIIAFRNLLIHGYAVVNHTRVWNVIHGSLPELRSCVQALLLELGEP